MREAARRGPVILLPSHKSHVDYLVLSHVLGTERDVGAAHRGGRQPLVLPARALLRRCGAFFIRRSFQGRKLYAALVDAYLRRILVEGFNVEFFMEGGRSRTGKLLPPKLGLLSMVVDAGCAALGGAELRADLHRVRADHRGGARTPASSAAARSEPETVGGLLRSSRVLRSRYGRLYIQFGEIFDLRELVDEIASGCAATASRSASRAHARRSVAR